MRVFADTSGLFALMVHNDSMHVRAKENFRHFSEHGALLLTSSFVLVETVALLQRRIGIPPVEDFCSRIFPLLEILWVDNDWYGKAMQRLLMLKDRKVSLVDCLSFEIMEARDMKVVFAFDQHFEEHGFTLAAFYNLDDVKG